jgi:hypothetical protein
MEIRQYLAHHMPELNALIVVENYPAAEVYVILASLANFAMMFVCGLLFFGDAILGALGIQQVPAFLEVVRENKMKTVMFMFLVNSFAQKLTATGTAGGAVRVGDAFVWMRVCVCVCLFVRACVHMRRVRARERAGVVDRWHP